MQAIATAEPPSRISHEKVLVVFGGLLLVMLLAALDSTIVATALPTMALDLLHQPAFGNPCARRFSCDSAGAEFFSSPCCRLCWCGTVSRYDSPLTSNKSCGSPTLIESIVISFICDSRTACKFCLPPAISTSLGYIKSMARS